MGPWLEGDLLSWLLEEDAENPGVRCAALRELRVLKHSGRWAL